MHTLAVFRTLSRMVQDAARTETPFLLVFDADYGYLLKDNMPAPKAISATVGPASVPPKHEDAPAQRSRSYPKHQAAPRPSERARSPRNAQRKHQEKSRRSRCPRRRGPSVTTEGSKDRNQRDTRLNARAAGQDDKGPLRGMFKNCYVGLGTHVPAHQGTSRQDLGNPCYIPRRARICEQKGACLWARERPDWRQLNERTRERTRKR